MCSWGGAQRKGWCFNWLNDLYWALFTLTSSINNNHVWKNKDNLRKIFLSFFFREKHMHIIFYIWAIFGVAPGLLLFLCSWSFLEGLWDHMGKPISDTCKSSILSTVSLLWLQKCMCFSLCYLIRDKI